MVDNERPPYVTFERRAVEDRNASIAAGHYVAMDVDFAMVTRPGSKDTFESEALPYLASLKEKARAGLIPLSWDTAFSESYKRWQAGEALPANGTPIKIWPVLSPAARETIIRAGFLTIEDLANANDVDVLNIGTGGISYKLKAQAWLEAAEDKGKSVERINALVQQVSDLTELVNKLVAENKKLSTPAVTAKA